MFQLRSVEGWATARRAGARSGEDNANEDELTRPRRPLNNGGCAKHVHTALHAQNFWRVMHVRVLYFNQQPGNSRLDCS